MKTLLCLLFTAISLFGQCTGSGSITSVSNGAWIDNRFTTCNTFNASYTVTGFTTVYIVVQGAADSSGTPGTPVTMTLSAGNNPSFALGTYAVSWFMSNNVGHTAWVRYSVLALSGSGSIAWSIKGQNPTPPPGTGHLISVTDAPYNADPTGTISSRLAFQLALSQNNAIFVPPGTYTLDGSISIPRNGMKVICTGSGYQTQAPTILRFTNAGDGFTLGNTNNVEIDDCLFQTTNTSAGKAINITTTTGAGHKLNRLSFFNGSGGTWSYGIYVSGAIGVTIDTPYCFSIVKCISFNALANGNDVRMPLLGGSGTTGIEINGSINVNVWGGIVEGSYTLLGSVDASSSTLWDGVYLESSGSQVNAFSSQGQTTLRNITLGGGSVTGAALLFTGTASASIDGLNGFVTSPSCMIEADGNTANTAQNFTVNNVKAFNASTAAGSHSLCIGTSTTGWWSALVTGSYWQSHDTAIVAKSAAGLITIGRGNTFNSSASGIDASGANLIQIDGNNFPSVSSACVGCKLSNMLFPSNNVLNNTQQFALPQAPVVADLPSCNQFVAGILGYYVTDATLATPGSTVVGGGATTVAVHCSKSGGGTGPWIVY